MRKSGKILGCCLITVSLLACTACSGFDRLSDNLKDGAKQLSDDVVIGKSNALITPYQSFEGSRTSDNDAFQATYDASVMGFDGQDILVADTLMFNQETVSSSIFPLNWRKKCLLNPETGALPFNFKRELTILGSLAQTIQVLSRLLWNRW